MQRLRRLVLVLLLLTVPFQAAMGAAGIYCAAVDNHPQPTSAASHDHDMAMSVDHHGASPAHTRHEAPADQDSQDAHGTADKCKVCSESCCSAAATSTSQLVVFFPDSPLRVSAAVDPDLVSRSGDGLFRPPRTHAA